MKRRFIVVVLDGFGMGAMADAATARPGDETAGTLRSILEDYPDLINGALEFKIITKHPEEVKQIIMKNYRHGCTELKSKGGFTQSESTTILTVINIRELSGFLTKLSQIPDTFAYYTEVNGLQGNFRWRREDPAN